VHNDNRNVEGRFDALQVSLQSVDSDNDGLVQRCEAVLGFRLPPRWPPRALIETLEAMALPYGVRLATSGPEQAYRGPKDSPLARAFRVAIREKGARPRAKVKTGTSDMNVVAPHWQVPMVAYGPGDASLDHTPDERLDLHEYLRAVEVLRGVFGQLADAHGAPAAG
jgi:LysW-gamma-L-lysine carboxypeptidase